MTVCVARSTRSVPSRVDDDHSGRAAVLDEQVGGEPSLVDFGTRSLDRDRQRPLDLGAGRVAARVDDAGHGVAALSSEREGSVDAVEVRAQRHELADTRRSFGREHAHRVGVVEPTSGGERVGAVQLGRVVVFEQRGRDATLRVPGGRPAELALREHGDREPGVAGPDRGREAGSATAEYEDISHE